MKSFAAFFGAILTVMLQSCLITNTPGFYSGYNKLTPDEQSRIKFLADNAVIPERYNDTIYAVSAKNLLQKMRYEDTSVVYLWSPNCHSKVCVSLAGVQTLSSRLGYMFYPVLEYYDIPKLTQQGKTQNPTISINHRYYKTDYCPKYTARFLAELRNNTTLADSVKDARYYIFSRGKFVRVVNSL